MWKNLNYIDLNKRDKLSGTFTDLTHCMQRSWFVFFVLCCKFFTFLLIVCAGFHRLFNLKRYWIVGGAYSNGGRWCHCPGILPGDYALWIAEQQRQQQQQCVQRRMLHLWLINVPAIWDDDDDDNVDDHDDEEDDDDDEHDDVDHYEQLFGGANGR